jgi:nitroimidazol reductase NimA-like FMN-containing flavoprotein (pyridoxamine 5'-phosphate oxidase superfamily)
MTDLSDMARGIIEANRYMVLGTADEAGVPWVTPVWYAQSDYRRFVWVSSPDRRHSRNARVREDVSIVIFDSQVAVGSARAVYMSARAEELSGGDLERGVAFFDAATQAQGLTRRWALEDMLAPAPYRLYRATVSQHWVLDQTAVPTTAPRSRCRAVPMARLALVTGWWRTR